MYIQTDRSQTNWRGKRASPSHAVLQFDVGAFALLRHPRRILITRGAGLLRESDAASAVAHQRGEAQILPLDLHHHLLLQTVQMLVFFGGEVVPHEVRQSQQVLDVVAAGAAAVDDLVGDVSLSRFAEPEGVLRGRYVDEDVEGLSSLGVESRQVRYVASQFALAFREVGDRICAADGVGYSVDSALREERAGLVWG